MSKFKPFEIGEFVRVIGREGTNGPLKHGELYEVTGLTDENNAEGFARHLLAVQPIIVNAGNYEQYKPFLGKIERVK